MGNDSKEAVLEVHFPAPQLLLVSYALIAVTGADLSATLNDELVPMWHPVVVRRIPYCIFPNGSRSPVTWQYTEDLIFAVADSYSTPSGKRVLAVLPVVNWKSR